MRLHHLNCISSCPLGGRLMDGRSGSVLERGRLCCHCLLLETADSLVLVDTGFGLRDVRQPRQRLSTFFLGLLSPDFREDMTAVRQIEALGFSPRDVRHIVLTHLDFDHAGGLDDFPDATVHLLRRERDDAVRQHSWLDRQRYRPQQWSTQRHWHVYGRGLGAGDGAQGGERWFGFEGVRGERGLPPDILLVPLAGHTLGHAGVAVKHDGGWLLQAGDAYFWHEEMDVAQPRCTPGLAFYQTMMEKDRRLRLQNQQRLRDLRRDHGESVTIVCSHDPVEYERITARPISAPVGSVQPLPA